jgi:hypothetical protein
MRQILAIFLISSTLLSCGGADESVLTIKSSISKALIIPTVAASCFAKLTATAGSPVSTDITSAYFRIPRLIFTKKNVGTDLYIVLLRIKMQVPNSGAYECTFAGENLASLNSIEETNGGSSSTSLSWWRRSTQEAIIPAGSTTWQTDCPLYCGAVNVEGGAFSTTATIEIIGYEQTPGSDLQLPLKVFGSLQVENPI